MAYFSVVDRSVSSLLAELHVRWAEKARKTYIESVRGDKKAFLLYLEVIPGQIGAPYTDRPNV